MGRPIYTYELTDPDFSWLVTSYKENNPSANTVEGPNLPVVFIKTPAAEVTVPAPVLPAPEESEFKSH